MHDTAMRIGEAFFRNYLREQTAGKILDLGGLNVNGSLREVAPRGWNYISVDSSSGPGGRLAASLAAICRTYLRRRGSKYPTRTGTVGRVLDQQKASARRADRRCAARKSL
jgi:hypothetical protein